MCGWVVQDDSHYVAGWYGHCDQAWTIAAPAAAAPITRTHLCRSQWPYWFHCKKSRKIFPGPPSPFIPSSIHFKINYFWHNFKLKGCKNNTISSHLIPIFTSVDILPVCCVLLSLHMCTSVHIHTKYPSTNLHIYICILVTIMNKMSFHPYLLQSVYPKKELSYVTTAQFSKSGN